MLLDLFLTFIFYSHFLLSQGKFEEMEDRLRRVFFISSLLLRTNELA